MPTAVLEDGSRIDVSISGDGACLLMPGRRRGAGAMLPVEGLASAARIVAFDYEAHVVRQPRPRALTVDAVTRDLLAVADAAGAATFSYVGHSWLALAGAHLAQVSDRMRGLVIGSPPSLQPPTSDPADPPSCAGGAAGADRTRLDTFLEDARTRTTLSRAAFAELDLPRLCLVGDGSPLLRPSGADLSATTAPWWDPVDLERSGWAVSTPGGAATHTGSHHPLAALVPWLASLAADHRCPSPATQREGGVRDRLCVEPASAPAGGDSRRAQGTYADRTDAYLADCGIPEEYVHDEHLRSRAQQLLAMQEVRSGHLQATDDAARRVPDPMATAGRTAEGGASAPPVHLSHAFIERQREQLEVAIIVRYQELRRMDHDRASGEGPIPLLRAVDDD